MEQSETTRRINNSKRYVEAVTESRIFWRRQLAHDLAVEMVGRPNSHPNVAQFVEDFANAVAERVWAREDKEIEEAGHGVDRH